MSSAKASTKVDVVTVEANVEGGVPTGVMVRADDMFTINASGIAGYAGQTDPMTLPDGSRFIGGKFAGAWYDPAATLKGVPIGMLIAPSAPDRGSRSEATRRSRRSSPARSTWRTTTIPGSTPTTSRSTSRPYTSTRSRSLGTQRPRPLRRPVPPPARDRERFVGEVLANMADSQRWWQRLRDLLSVAVAVPGLAVILRRARRGRA